MLFQVFYCLYFFFQVFSAFMVGLHSFFIHNSVKINTMVYHGIISNQEDVFSLILYVFEVVFNITLVYGAHKVSVDFFYNILFKEQTISQFPDEKR